jgi:hypothetical protein
MPDQIDLAKYPVGDHSFMKVDVVEVRNEVLMEMIVSKVTLAVRFLLKHWDREKRPYTPDLNGCNDSWFALLPCRLTRLQGRGRELTFWLLSFDPRLSLG